MNLMKIIHFNEQLLDKKQQKIVLMSTLVQKQLLITPYNRNTNIATFAGSAMLFYFL